MFEDKPDEKLSYNDCWAIIRSYFDEKGTVSQ